MLVHSVLAAWRGHLALLPKGFERGIGGVFACVLMSALAGGVARADSGDGIGAASDVGNQVADNKADSKADSKGKDPALLIADDLTSDEQLGLVIARGNVELAQGGRTIRADTVAYNQKSKVVIASGNVRMFEPGGDVIFTDYAELTDDLREAFINKVRIILAGNTRATGTEAERVGGRYTRLNHATYSPCALCAGHPEVPPIWQVRARKMAHDAVDKDVRYTDAVMEVLGQPVFYMPYFSHPDPSVKRRSGLLAPLVGGNRHLGQFYRQGYYLDIQPDLDATLEPTVYTKQNPMLGGEVRKRFEKGRLSIAGSLIYADNYVSNGLPGHSFRGYARVNSLFDVNDAWRWGTNINYSSDKTFLSQFYGFHGNQLTSRAFAEGFYGRDYVTLRGYQFQDMSQNNHQVAPTVPLAQYSMMGEPGDALGGRWSLESGLVGVARGYGPESTRMSFEPGWSRELVSGTGMVTTINARARADVWKFADYRRVDLRTGEAVTDAHNGAVTRVFPQAQVKFAYPLVRNGELAQQVVEPLVAFTAAPHLSNKRNVPNEDSRDVELDDTSLFRFNRYVGNDRQEGGQRATYGVRAGYYGLNEGSGGIFVGQDRRLSNDQPFAEGSGLGQRGSDLVGHVSLSPAKWFYADYRVNSRGERAVPRRESVTTSMGGPILTVSTGYHYDHDAPDPNDVTLTHREEFMSLGARSQLSRYWSTSFAHTQAFRPNPGARTSGALLTYADECLIFQTVVNVDFTSQTGLGPSQTIYFRLVFKNLGEVSSPNINPAGMFSGHRKEDQK